MNSTGLNSMRLLVPLAVATALLLPSSAWADEARVQDATGDVFAEAGAGHDPIPQGSEANTDVRRTVIRHGRETVRLVVQYVELTAGVSKGFGVNAGLRVPGPADVTLLVSVEGDLERTTLALVEFDGVAHDCPDASVAVKPATDRLVVSVPRSCLGDPEWIRVTASADSVAQRDGRIERFTDNLLARDIHSPKRTKRLYVG